MTAKSLGFEFKTKTQSKGKYFSFQELSLEKIVFNSNLITKKFNPIIIDFDSWYREYHSSQYREIKWISKTITSELKNQEPNKTEDTKSIINF